jgi:hydroxypyruvate reductase
VNGARFDRAVLRDLLRREGILSLLEEVLRALHPAVLLPANVRRLGDRLDIVGREHSLVGRRILAVGAGKASAEMALALERILRDRLADGVVVTRYGHAVPTEQIRVLEAGHPIPDENGLAASRAVLTLAESVQEDDLVIGLFSGGGSALLPLPVGGVTLADLAETTRLLLLSGAAIEEVNTVRRHLSRLQGGQLARTLYPATVASLLLSDVLGDRIEAIASGPTAPDPTTFADARDVLLRYDPLERVPEPVREHLRRGASGEVPETPKPGDPIFSRVEHVLLAGVASSSQIACRKGERQGFRVGPLPVAVEGEARDLGARLARAAQDLAERGEKALLVGSGETTVTVRGGGLGGRNQEAALSAAVGLDGVRGAFAVCFATDGSDGPTDAAGAIVDGETSARARSLSLSLERALAENDAHPLLRATGDLLLTGPTGTNVADLVLVGFDPGR